MSFYILEIVLEGDLSRRDYYIYNNLSKIREKLYSYLIAPVGCYETVWYGSDINIYVCYDYMPVDKIDMHSRIAFSLEKYSHIYFDSENKPIVINNNESQTIAINDAEYDEYFCTDVCNGDEDISVFLDMSDIPILGGRLIDKQEIFSLPIFPDTQLHYGHNDMEYGNDMSDSSSSYEFEYD